MMSLLLKNEYEDMITENIAIPYPLNIFYNLQSDEGPEFEEVSAIDIPEPQKTLLCHTNDMTPTLEKYFNEAAHLSLLNRQSGDGYFFRHIALVDKNDNPMELGAIQIYISKFPPQAQLLINESFIPLGTIYKMFSIRHINKPQSYYRVKSDQKINEIFRLSETTNLYCRINRQVNSDDELLALALEILPPFPKEAE
jgi:hypothetical protein